MNHLQPPPPVEPGAHPEETPDAAAQPPGTIHVLLVQDRADDATLIERSLRQAGLEPTVVCVETEPEMSRALDHGAWDVVLSDYALSRFGAPAALRVLQERGLDIPLVVVTDTIGEETAAEMMRAGARDYVLKRKLSRLGPTVERELSEAADRARRRQAEARLAHSEARLRLLAENARDLIYRYELVPVRGFSYVSPSATEMVGYTPQEHYADPDLGLKLVLPEDAPLLQKLIGGDSSSQPVVLRWRRKDGSLLWVEQHNVLVRDDQGQVVAIEGIGRDVTERVAAEQERLRLLEAEREARAEAEAALKTREAFFAAVSHDLKSPLTAIGLFAGALQRQMAALASSEDPAAFARRASAALDRIGALATSSGEQVDELLDVGRLQANERLPLFPRSTDLVALARARVELHGLDPRGRMVRLESDLDSLVGQWDAARLGRVLDNLVSNGLKYSPPGGEVLVRIHRHSRWAVLEVRDAGIGIPPGDLPHIFERFYRAGNVRDRVPGTGLGLWGSRAIVEQHGGTVDIASTEGQGTTVTVRLPLSPRRAEVSSRGSRHRVANLAVGEAGRG